MTEHLLDAVPMLGSGFRLQWEPAQEAHVLLYPEGMVKINRSAGEILTRCDGQRSLRALIGELEAAFQAQGLAHEVCAFVELAVKQRWLSLSEPPR